MPDLVKALRGGGGVESLKKVIASWMDEEWPRKGAALVAGRAEALARWVQGESSAVALHRPLVMKRMRSV